METFEISWEAVLAIAFPNIEPFPELELLHYWEE